MPPPAVLLFLAAQVLLFPYLLNLGILTALSWWARRRPRLPPDPAPLEYPPVTVQLPIYNEPGVAGRLLEAVGELDYPRDRLEIQVVDDSTDETSEILAAGVARLRGRGLTVTHRRRTHREGFKAGSLAAALPHAQGELIAVLDADCVPPRDFLTRTVPRFADPGVCAVQARLDYLNRTASLVTVGHALLLDVGFEVELPARSDVGRFPQFLGTGAVWRRAAIEAAGGWSSDTLTEDLDLSVRAQLGGRRLVYEPDVVCGMELVASIGAWKTQQRRWVAGHAQTALKLASSVARAPLSAWTRYQGLMTVTFEASAVLTLALVVLSAPIFGVHEYLAAAPRWAAVAGALGAPGLCPLIALVYAQLVQGRPGRARLIQLPVGVLLATGIVWTMTLAVARALAGRERHWVRTPKLGSGAANSPRAEPRARAAFPWSGAGELALAACCGWAVWRYAQEGIVAVLPFLALMGTAFLTVGALSFAEFVGRRRALGEAST